MAVCRSRGEPGGERHIANSFNALFGARLGARPFYHGFAPKLQFAGRSKPEAHCLALQGSPLDRPLRYE